MMTFKKEIEKQKKRYTGKLSKHFKSPALNKTFKSLSFGETSVAVYNN